MEISIMMIWQVFQIVLMVSGIICTLIGLVTILYWFKKPTAPSDDTNRINNIKSWWIGLTRPQVMGKAYKSFRQDVLKNIKDIEKK